MAPGIPVRPIKVLMLHGYTQSGHIFNAKTGALRKALNKAFPAGITFVYPDAPLRLFKADIPNWDNPNDPGSATKGSSEDDPAAPPVYGWWRRKGTAEPYTYEGVEVTLAKVSQVLKEEGPFDGVLGFSQGGALAGMVASLLEPGRRAAFEAAQAMGGMAFPESFSKSSSRNGAGHEGEDDAIHPPMKFAVSYSGYAASTSPTYMGFYKPKIKTPMLHFLGTVDTVVEEARSLRLVEACEYGAGEWSERVIYHPGGHFLPSSQKQYVDALSGFIRKMVTEEQQPAAAEENVEDMDVPF